MIKTNNLTKVEGAVSVRIAFIQLVVATVYAHYKNEYGFTAPHVRAFIAELVGERGNNLVGAEVLYGFADALIDRGYGNDGTQKEADVTAGVIIGKIEALAASIRDMRRTFLTSMGVVDVRSLEYIS
jgi:hypothetical protein